MFIPNRERILVELLREVAAETGIEMTTFSQDWIIHLRQGAVARHVYGYNFDLNPAAAQLIACDKTAASDLLAFHDIPRVEHRLFLHPRLSAYVDAGGNWRDMLAFAEQCGWDVVCKPKDGTGGRDVHRARGRLELEQAVHRLFESEHALSLSPFLAIDQEYRFIVLAGQCELAYAKRRPAVLGDGRSTIAELIAAAIKAGAMPAEVAARAIRDHEPRLDDVPPHGAVLDLHWKHNLGQGSRPHEIADAALRCRLTDLACRCARALNLQFASVDIVEVAARHMVLEVNSGIMMETYARTAPNGRETAKRIYAKAVKRMLAP
jgi:hypothetical protein